VPRFHWSSTRRIYSPLSGFCNSRTDSASASIRHPLGTVESCIIAGIRNQTKREGGLPAPECARWLYIRSILHLFAEVWAVKMDTGGFAKLINTSPLLWRASTMSPAIAARSGSAFHKACPVHTVQPGADRSTCGSSEVVEQLNNTVTNNEPPSRYIKASQRRLVGPISAHIYFRFFASVGLLRTASSRVGKV